MGCSGCSNGKTDSGLPRGCKNNGTCESGGCDKLSVFNYLANMEETVGYTFSDFVEVRFKNTRKQFYRQEKGLALKVGEAVTVDANPGFDVGTVSLAGDLVMLQMRKHKVEPTMADIRSVLRRATQLDIDKWQGGVDLEEPTKKRARVIARELGLNMKVSDVEYQGDRTKAVFYYTSEDRVDFRDLVRKYSEAFKVRIEMRQIGSRQEAARVGGIGTCGRELCCTTWLTDFRTVTTGAARYQQLSLNPEKLAGQCGKLKCCLNYELDSYIDALKDFPSQKTKLETKKGVAVPQKIDIFKGLMYFTYKDDFSNFIPVPIARVKEIVSLNKKSERPDDLIEFASLPVVEKQSDYENVVGQDDLTRFDRPKGTGNKRNKKKSGNRGGAQASGQPAGNDRPTQPAQQRPVAPARPPSTPQATAGTPPQSAGPRPEGGQSSEGNRSRNRNRNRNRNKGNKPS